MERCSAPCVKYVEVNDYKHQLEEAVMVLSGKGDKLCNDLKKQMQNYAEAEDFEQAALIRDQLQSLELVTQMQTVVQAGVEASKDVMAVAKEGFLVHGVVLQIRGGKLLSVKHYDLQNAQADMSEKEILSQFLIQHYTAQEEGVSSVLLSEVPEDLEWIEKTLQISIFVPDSAFDQELINVAKTNALHALELFSKRTEGHGIDALEEVQKKLNLLKLPERIECYDISNIQGEDAVASRVVFIDGAPDKNLYRRYKIKTVEGANDFAMMKEVLGRRFARTEDAFPDLVLVDGGKGQLSQASQILEELNVQGVEIAGLAKARTESNFKGKEVRASMERIFLPNRKNPVFLSPHTLSFKILTHLRDEAHRFAITYHRKLRDKIEPS